MNPETKIETKACELILEHLGVEGIKFVSPGNTGYPDRLFLMPGGVAAWIEFKQPGEEPEPKQLSKINRLKQFGFSVAVKDDPVDALEYIAHVIEKKVPLAREKRRKLRNIFSETLPKMRGES